MTEILRVLKDGTISECVLCLKEIKDKKYGAILVKEVVDQIGHVVNKLSSLKGNTVESVEKFLALVGVLVAVLTNRKI